MNPYPPCSRQFRQLKRCSRWTAALLSLVTAGVLLASVSLFGTTI